MSVGCSVPECSNASVLLCNACGDHFCSEHSKLHDQLLHSALNPLKKEAKILSNRYQKLNPTKLLNESRLKLDQWKKDSYQEIDRLYEQKCTELPKDWRKKYLQTEKDLEEIQLKINQLIIKPRTTHEDIDQTANTIQTIEKSLLIIEENEISIDIDQSSMKKNQFIQIENKEEKEMIENPGVTNIEILNLSIVNRRLFCSNESGIGFIGTNEYLLIYQKNEFLLFNEEFLLIRQCLWNNGTIFDLCYLSLLKEFLFLTDKRQIYLLNPQTMLIKRIENISEEKWWSCTSINQSLFLSTYGTNIQISLFNIQFSSFKQIKYWRSPQICLEYEHIHQIKSSNEYLGIIISNSNEKTTRLEMRSIQTFQRFWTFLLNIPSSLYQSTIRLCSFPFNQWIIIIENNSQLFHIDQNGKLKSLYSYDQPVWNASFFANHFFVIRTSNEIHFHQI